MERDIIGIVVIEADLASPFRKVITYSMITTWTGEEPLKQNIQDTAPSCLIRYLVDEEDNPLVRVW